MAQWGSARRAGSATHVQRSTALLSVLLMATFGLVGVAGTSAAAEPGTQGGEVCEPREATNAVFSAWSQSGLTPVQHNNTPPADPDGQTGDTNPLNLQMIGSAVAVTAPHVTQAYVAPTAATADTWTGQTWWNFNGSWDGAQAPPADAEGWHAPPGGPQPNGQHNFADHTPNVAYNVSTGNSGNVSWFRWTATLVPGTQGDPGLPEISHTDYQFQILSRTYTPGQDAVVCDDETDACPNSPATSPPCGMGPDRESRTVTTVDCQTDTVSSQPQVRTRTYSWNGNNWVPGAWSDWANDGTATLAGASDAQCPPPAPYDECIDIEGDQPVGTDCENPGPLMEQRSTTTTDCQADTVTTVIEEQVTTFTLDELGTWVPTLGGWDAVSSVIRPANNKECEPDTEVEGEQGQIDDKDDQDKNKPNPVEVKGAQASAPPKVTAAVTPAAQVPTVVAAGLGESTPAQPGRSPLALLMVLMGALLSAAAATRRWVRA